jgi:hypothetical protein
MLLLQPRKLVIWSLQICNLLVLASQLLLEAAHQLVSIPDQLGEVLMLGIKLPCVVMEQHA